jgi:hypothetical protein
MSSIIFGPSNPKNVFRCENCNLPILFYQERICNLGKRIPYGQDGKPHQCRDKPDGKDFICYCKSSVEQSGKNKSADAKISESVGQVVSAGKQPMSETRLTIDHFTKTQPSASRSGKFQHSGGAKGPNVN